MKILVIDAYRRPEGPGRDANAPVTPKSRVCKLVADAVGAKMVWRSPATVDDPILGGFDVLVFNRALPEIGQNAAWLEANPNARIVHITNDYSVGGGALYAASGRPVVTIANHPQQMSRVAGMTSAPWHTVNVNALLFEPDRVRPRSNGDHDCVYYGACRPERFGMFSAYLAGHVDVSHNATVCKEFASAGVPGPFVAQVNWATDGLVPWRSVLYLQDDRVGSTPFFSNRFYEALSYDRWTVFTEESRATMEQSGYAIPDALVVNRPEGIAKACRYEDRDRLAGWRRQAAQEQQDVLQQIRQIVQGA